MIETTEKKIKTIFPYMLLLVVLVTLHWNMGYRSDDEIFKTILDNTSIVDHIKNYYLYINGKIFPDTMAAIFAHGDLRIWKCINIAIFLTVAICINKLFFEEENNKWLGCAVVILMPFNLLQSAGYIATSTNYVWCTAALLIALLPIKYGEKLKSYQILICLCGAIYAGNQEQTAAILLVLYMLYCINGYMKKQKICKCNWFMFGVSIFNMIFLFTAPGHSARSNIYTIFNQPDFLQLSFFDKFFRGFTSTMAYLWAGKNFIWPLLCITLFLMVLVRYKENKLIIIISAMPVFGSLGVGFFQDYIMPQSVLDLFKWYPEWGYSMWDYRYINAMTYTDYKYYLPIVFSVVMLGIIYLEIFWIYKYEKNAIIVFLSLSAGLASRIIMGISPTLYGSSFRTFIELYFAVGICIVVLLHDLITKYAEEREVVYTGKVLIIISVIGTFYISYHSII